MEKTPIIRMETTSRPWLPFVASFLLHISAQYRLNEVGSQDGHFLLRNQVNPHHG